VRPTELVNVLKECHREKLALRQRHVAVARHVTGYEFNNAYQYVIAREDVPLSWLEAAIADLGDTPDDEREPDIPAPGKKESYLPLVESDAKLADAFVSRWQSRLSTVTHARHHNMIRVILGETLEQKRFFEQMLAGNADLLGRRANGPGPSGTGDGVLPVRWIE
jgi:hypothetical protein